MIRLEIIDNLSQFILTFIVFLYTVNISIKSQKQPYFLLACFYGTYMLGTLHWTLYLILFNTSPQVFYVSELAWFASFMLLVSLEHTVSSEEVRKFRHSGALIIFLFCVPQLIFYLSFGDVVSNLLMCSTTMLAGYYALRGFIYARKQSGKERKMQYFHVAVLGIIVLEYCLWTASCFWISDTITNPYFWFDFILTASIFALLPVTRNVVEI